MNYQKKEKVIPIFYASDENYLMYLSISLYSLKENRNKNTIIISTFLIMVLVNMKNQIS